MGRRAIHEKVKDLLLALGLLAVGIVALLVINVPEEEIPIASGATLTYATMPSIYGGLLIALAVLYMATTLHAMRAEWLAAQRGQEDAMAAPGQGAEGDAGEPTLDRKTILLRTWGTLVALLAYVILLEYVHFSVLTTLFLFVMFLLFGQRLIKKVAFISVCGGAAFYFLFIYILKLPI